MAGYFLDTSALAKLYHFEAGSNYVAGLVGTTRDTCYVSRLSLVEIESAFATKVRTQAITAADRLLALRQFRIDLAVDLVSLGPPLEEFHLRSAASLVQTYGVTHGLRSLDAIQLAVALDLHKNLRVSVLLSSDHRLLRGGSALRLQGHCPRGATLIYQSVGL